MLLRNFLLGPLLTVSSASALPNPEADAVDVATRDTDVDIGPRDAAAKIDSRGVDFDDSHHQGCGHDASWDGHTCVCKKHDMIFNFGGRSCGCPSGLRWDGHRCKRRNRDAHMDSRDNVAEIDAREFDDTLELVNRAPPRHNCGRDADWDGHQCVCRNRGQNFNPRDRTCRCPQGQTWDGSRCRRAGGRGCGRDANWDGHQCVCRNRGQNFNPRDRTCKCRQGQTWDGHMCRRR